MVIRLAQMAVAAVCIISGAAVARAAVKTNTERWWQLAAGVALSVVFVYAAIKLSSRPFYVTG